MTDPFNRHTEARTFGGNADIAARRDFEPTTGARPLDHGDGRVLAVEQDLRKNPEVKKWILDNANVIL